MNEPIAGLKETRRLVEIQPERRLSWLERRLESAARLAREVLLRTGRRPVVPPVPPTFELRQTDWKVVPVPRPILEKNAELKANSVIKQWKPPAL